MGGFKKYVDILAEGGGMSDDEPGPGPRSTTARAKASRQYFVIRPAWRSPEVTNWLRVMDHLYLGSRFAADGRATRGKWTRDRVQSNKVDQAAQAIKGLPENFYDKVWLASLSPKKKRRLNVKEAINLTHTEEIMRYVDSSAVLLSIRCDFQPEWQLDTPR